MNTTRTHEDPTAAESYRVMAPHVPTMRALVHERAVDAADEALLVAALGLEVASS